MSKRFWFMSVLMCFPIVAWCAGPQLPGVGAGIKHVISGVGDPVITKMKATVDEYP